MTRNPVVVADDATVGEALNEMRRIGVRRVPVVDERGYLAGVLSLDDIIEDLARGLGDVAGSIKHEIAVERALRS